MSTFTTRVELHAASFTDYDNLHSEMRRQGFTREISSGQGVTYHLPTAEYNITGTMTSSDVLNRAKAAVSKIGKTGAVLVTAGPRTWDGLAQK